MRIMLVAISVMLMIASASQAGDGFQCFFCSMGVSCPDMQVTACPQGDFEMIRNGCGGSDAYIWVEIRDDSNRPIPGIPWTDFWFKACDPWQDLYICTGRIRTDSLTGTNGRTTFSGLFEAGGCHLNGGISIACSYAWIGGAGPTSCLPLVIKSPDMTGAGGYPDGIVNLSDLVPFGSGYNRNLGQAGYNACCDYNDDNKCNLSDFAFFSTHYQHRCS